MSDFARVEKDLEARKPSRMLPDRNRIDMLLDLLGNPQRAYPVIHVTGTNGKTSTTRMCDALLRAHNLRVGRHTSPHLDSVVERIAIDGEPLDPERFAAVYDEVAPFVALIDARSPEPVTYFELTAAMAFAAFADAPVDAAVVEVGMGGSWDATNAADGRVAIITPIGLDHQHFLGDTVEEITGEKAGIIKPGAVAVLADQPADAVAVLLRRAAEVDATVAREGVEFGVLRRRLAVGGQVLTMQGLSGVYEQVFVPLHGAHQAQNAALALAAVEAFLGAGPDRPLDVEVVREGFAQATSPGRLERVRRSPAVLLDAAHNPAGMIATVTALAEEFTFSRLVAVVSVLADKDAGGMLELLEPFVDAVVVTRNSSPRCMELAQLADIAQEIFGNDRVHVEPALPDAIDRAVAIAEQGAVDLSGAGVLVTGSVVTVADARRLFVR